MIFSICASIKAPPVVVPPAPPTETPVLARGTTDSTTYSNFILYTTKWFKIYTLIKKSANFSDDVLNQIKDALDYWSLVLRDTVLPGQTQPTTIYDGTAYVTNPLKFANDGYVLCINQITAAANINGAGSKIYVRSNPGYKYHQLPSVGYFYINSVRTSALLSNITPTSRTELFYITVHEIGHALGIGTSWYSRSGSLLNRSFIVGAGDMSTNTARSVVGNIFYTTNRGNGSRTANNTGTMIGYSGDTSYAFAYNPNTPVGNSSAAVSAYNECFGLALTAIPVENGAGDASYGSHWAEGDASGYDRRQYYGNVYPGAPALQDELMTPSGEGTWDTPISKITLGALVDLGWDVDMSLADNYEPLVNVIRYDATDTFFEVKKNNFGGYKAAWTGGSSFVLFSHLRKGVTYTFLNETGEDLRLTTLYSDPWIDGVVTGVRDDGKPFLQWTVSTNYTGNVVLVRGSKTNAINVWYVV